MDTSRIEFISSYCDRWCERCPYTDRCSAFACHVAVAMCGDVEEGLELAVGAPHPVDGDPPARGGAGALPDLPDVELSAEDMAAYERLESARKARIQASPLSVVSSSYAVMAHRWLGRHQQHLLLVADVVVIEALDVVAYDAAFIGAKIHRALHGRDRHEHDGEDAGDEDPVQNDWNGSAKIALISIERSEAAWRVIAEATGHPVPSTLADALIELERSMHAEFPFAMTFVRPGFDEPWR